MTHTPLPPRAETPFDEFHSFMGWLNENRLNITVDIDGENGKKEYEIRKNSGDLSEEAKRRAIQIVDALMRVDEPGWAEGKGSIGYVSLHRGEAFLNADGREEDWSWEHGIEEDQLEGEEWEDDPSPSVP